MYQDPKKPKLIALGRATAVNRFCMTCSYILIISSQICLSTDKLTKDSPISLGRTLVSTNQVFELGFFSPGNSTNRYIGLWYKNVTTRDIIWVANRENPLIVSDTNCSLTIGSDGNMRILDGERNTVWSTNLTVRVNETIAQLTDMGDFSLNDTLSGSSLWESYDNPGNSLLPGMRLGTIGRTQRNNILTSWKSNDDPATGNFVVGLSAEQPPQAFIWNGSKPYWRGGPWDGGRFIGIPEQESGYSNLMSLMPDNSQSGAYLVLNLRSVLDRQWFYLNPEGVLRLYYWEDDTKMWDFHWAKPTNSCDFYGVCGAFAICTNKSPICECLKGFVPQSSDEWSKSNWTRGCMRRSELLCEKNESSLANGNNKPDEFQILRGVKLPDHYHYFPSMDSDACKRWCLRNCSCKAYTFVTGIHCLAWTEDLVDIEQFLSGDQNLFLRLAFAEIGKETRGATVFITLTTIGGVLFLGGFVFCLYRWKTYKKGRKINIYRFHLEDPIGLRDTLQEDALSQESFELPTYEFKQIIAATENFSFRNKLGEGGFGPVYKGMLDDGQQVAVKRLSGDSGQGIGEFKNEILLISKLQHRNLVKLLGCCIEGKERLLIYEYMTNKSLDTFLFDPKKRTQLDWATRFNIIQGIGRGLIYLHRDSCLRIIHRDLKCSNVLLDDKMNPKISDFGLARIFQMTQELANTRRIVGTYGYMSPEYAMGGVMSEKSDVYSYGVMLLEIMSGKRNTAFIHQEQVYLLAHAWKSWSEGRGIELMDHVLTESTCISEGLRCIHVGLLCVQDLAKDRPTMAEAVSMLSSETDLPEPKEPLFTLQRLSGTSIGQGPNNMCSVNEVTISMAVGRYILTKDSPISLGRTLVSTNQVFELGFFSPGNSTNRYIGLWYKNVTTRDILWVANRENPLTVSDTNCSLTIGSDGNMRILDGERNTVWWTNLMVRVNETIAQLTDMGDFSLNDTLSGSSLWESYDNPGNSLLPGMRLGTIGRTQRNNILTSWKSNDDPATGNFVVGLSAEQPPQAFIWNGSKPYWRGGPWDGGRFIGIPEQESGYSNLMSLMPDNSQSGAYLVLNLRSVLDRQWFYLNPEGVLRLYYWEDDTKMWDFHWAKPTNSCDFYGVCGAFAICTNKSPICECLKGFVPQSSDEWSKSNWTRGCMRRSELLCEKNESSLANGNNKPDEFQILRGVKLPDHYHYFQSMDSDACKRWCLDNCSCKAYTFVTGIHCMAWTEDLVDIKQFLSGDQNLFLRLAFAEIGKETRGATVFITLTTIGGVLFLGGFMFCLYRWKTYKKGRKINIYKYHSKDEIGLRDTLQEDVLSQESFELPTYEFKQIIAATDNFSFRNKLGEGGFGPVYKGMLDDGQQVAVKRLSGDSGQGIGEFKNEILLISKLQHRNLVKLLGCCIEGKERLLIYEYMTNKSLDTFLFDPKKRTQLDWATRFNIIQGIGRGLIYLHRDSCLRIIHRDLKCSNVLLDDKMNPKISDFGLARIFQMTQELANTRRIVGTYGYMSPEYAMGGVISEKSDVFSYGVMLLEIMSGKRNTAFIHQEQVYPLAHAWKLWSKGRGIELMDHALTESTCISEGLRCIHVGLLCVQDLAKDRPTMAEAVSMLSSETDLPEPKEPLFTLQRLSGTSIGQGPNNMCSVNEVTISMAVGR
uniref:uncharacterized protein LOC122592255 n=1 Tax=Erigeron canadensis TaxID=72917 RepID=UPI001CB8A4F6|nr:uncharacterized protein LOC122592255 [Erigeron canadensis]